MLYFFFDYGQFQILDFGSRLGGVFGNAEVNVFKSTFEVPAGN